MIEHFKRHFFKFLDIFTVVMRDKKLSQKSKIILEVQNNKRVPYPAMSNHEFTA